MVYEKCMVVIFDKQCGKKILFLCNPIPDKINCWQFQFSKP